MFFNVWPNVRLDRPRIITTIEVRSFMEHVHPHKQALIHVSTNTIQHSLPHPHMLTHANTHLRVHENKLTPTYLHKLAPTYHSR